MPATKTRRMVTAGGLEVRTKGDSITIEGHASTFNQPYDMGWYTETVAPGAFSRTLNRNPDVRMLINHDGLPLARTSSGTLELSQDNSGLYTRATLDPSDPDVKRLAPKMARGDLNQMSFQFGTVKDEWSDDYSQRTLRELNLDGGDVSIVTFPANPNATVSMRSRVLESGPDKLREIYRNVLMDSTGLAPQMRMLLENLAIEDEAVESSLTALSELVNESREAAEDAEAARAKVEAEIAARRARIQLELLKHSK